MSSQLSYDVVVVGAGPAGLAFACALANENLKIAVLEKEAESKLADPSSDGREIALTYKSIDTLTRLGAWQYIDPKDVSPIKKANVLNGDSPYVLSFDAESAHKEALGYLVSNYKIRKALYQAFKEHPHLTLISDTSLNQVISPDRLILSNGEEIATKLLVAADSRFSKTRQMMGISASMHDFGRTMMVCEMAHEKPHDHIAHECFFHNITLATLPMNGDRSSVVITLPASMTEQMLAMDPQDFAADIGKQLNHRLGKMSLTTRPVSFPLVGVYANRFYKERFALIGDAAVGMHPITAHGFNFGLCSIDLLSSKIKKAIHQNEPFYAEKLLKQYHRGHWLATRPLYLATNAIAKLYSNEKFPMTIVRNIGMQLAQRFKPCKKMIIQRLTQTSS